MEEEVVPSRWPKGVARLALLASVLKRHQVNVVPVRKRRELKLVRGHGASSSKKDDSVLTGHVAFSIFYRNTDIREKVIASIMINKNEPIMESFPSYNHRVRRIYLHI